MRFRLISGRWAKTDRSLRNYEVILKVEIQPGWFLRLFGEEERREDFIGSGTVWRSYPGFERQSTGVEMALADFYKAWIHHQERR